MPTNIEKRLQALEAVAYAKSGFRTVLQRLGETETEALHRAGLPEDFGGLTVFILRFGWDYRPMLHGIEAS
jgi:hypothetical protein